MGLAVTLGVRPSGKKYEVPEVGSDDLGSLVRTSMSLIGGDPPEVYVQAPEY